MAGSSTLPSLIAAETKGFVLERVSSSGSEANGWAINDATGLNTSLCLLGAGSYVAGDGSALQSLSTSEFSPASELALIKPPHEVRFGTGRANTVPLPYHIPEVLSARKLCMYEDLCLEAVHIKLCHAKMRGKPYKAILLELMLAGNGALLSDRALVSIGKLATHHGLCVIVDEVMTGARTGAMFYLLSKPPTFVAAVTHVTFGKWCHLGMIFVSKTWAEERTTFYPFAARGASTNLDTEEAVLQWQCVKKSLAETNEKRVKVLKKLKLNAEQAWGAGLIVFGPCHSSTNHGLKCRFLPMIHAGTPIDIRCTKVLPGTEFRVQINTLIVNTVKQWISDVPQPEVDSQSPRSVQKLDVERLRDYSFVSKMIKGSNELDEKPAAIWREEFMPKEVNRTEGESTMSRLAVAGCVTRTQVSGKRKREWKLKEGVVAPWKGDYSTGDENRFPNHCKAT